MKAFIVDLRTSDGKLILQSVIPLENIKYFTWNPGCKEGNIYGIYGEEWTINEYQYTALTKAYTSIFQVFNSEDN